MKLYEVEEAHSVIKSINEILLIFTTSKKTNEILKSYLEALIVEFEEQGSIVEDQDGNPIEIDIARQTDFLKHLLSIVENSDIDMTVSPSNLSN